MKTIKQTYFPTNVNDYTIVNNGYVCVSLEDLKALGVMLSLDAKPSERKAGK